PGPARTAPQPRCVPAGAGARAGAEEGVHRLGRPDPRTDALARGAARGRARGARGTALARTGGGLAADRRLLTPAAARAQTGGVGGPEGPPRRIGLEPHALAGLATGHVVRLAP